MRYANISNKAKPRRITRYDYGGTTVQKGGLDPNKQYYYDEYGNLLDHEPDTQYTDAKSKSQNTTNTIVAGVTAYNPIIGGLSGAAQAYGKGRREKNEAKDAEGRYLSTDKVGEGATSGSLWDPLSGSMEDWDKGNFWGGVEGLLSPATRAFSRGSEYKDEAQRHNAEIDEALKQKQRREDLRRSASVLATYPTHGISGASYYAGYGGKISAYPFGGTINTTYGSKAIANVIDPANGSHAIANTNTYADGGKLLQLASDSSIVKGDTHGEDTNRDGKTGVTLQDSQGNDYAEVEDNEVIIGDKVFSKRLGFSVPAAKLAKIKGDAELKAKSTLTHTRQTGIRNLEKVGMDIDGLYNAQEGFKKANGIGQETAKFSGGGEMGDPRAKPPRNYNQYWESAGNIAGNLTPYIDNAFNASQKRPSIPVPEMNVAAPLETTLNINPQLNEADASLGAYSKDIDQNTANSAVGNALKGSYYANTLRQKNTLIGNKMNYELGLRNNKAMNEQGITNTNIGTRNQYAMLNMQRRGEIQDMASANVANATGDAVKGVQDARSRELDREKMNLIVKAESMGNDAAAYQTWREVGSRAIKGDSNYEFYKSRMSGNPMAKKAWNDSHPEDPIR